MNYKPQLGLRFRSNIQPNEVSLDAIKGLVADKPYNGLTKSGTRLDASSREELLEMIKSYNEEESEVMKGAGVNTKAEEKDWKSAKEEAAKTKGKKVADLKKKDWGLVQYIYQKHHH